MVAHIQILDLAGDPAEDFEISLSGGEESAPIQLEIWNDKDDEFVDATTAQNVRAKLIASASGGPFVSSGIPIVDERWFRFRITHTLTAAGASTNGASGTLPIGTNSEIPIPDLEPQTGVRVELYLVAPGGVEVDAVQVKLSITGNAGSVPLSQFVTLATGSGVVPAERVSGLRSLLEGFTVTADDSDTVVIGRGKLVYDGLTVVKLETDETFNLLDSAAVAIGAGENYRVTLSATSAGVITATKGLQNEAVLWPEVPAGQLFVARLIVESADGVAVTVAQADVDQSLALYSQFLVRAGTGLTVLVAAGDGITDTDFRQPISHEISVSIADDATSRIWRHANGDVSDTLTDVVPEIGADLLALATTAGGAVTGIVDARRFAHRAMTEWPLELGWSGVLSDVGDLTFGGLLEGADFAVLHFDAECEEIALDLSDVDASWTSGAVKIDIRILAPGVPIGDGSGGVSMFTNSATDDRRPSIAFDAANLRATTQDHEVRRIVKGSRILLSVISTIEAPAPEPEQTIIATLNLRRYR